MVIRENKNFGSVFRSAKERSTPLFFAIDLPSEKRLLITYLSPQKKISLALAALLLFALILRLHNLGFESLWMDELRQVSYYPHSFGQIIHDAASQQQPPLDYWLGHLVHYFSSSDFAVRLPAALFGVGTVFFLTIIVAEICSWPVALGTGLIAALLPFNIYYSQEARPYAIAVFFLCGVLWSLDRMLADDGRSWTRVGLLFIFSTCFLLTRSLSPLVVTVILFAILASHYCILITREGFSMTGKQERIVIACIVLMLALLIYYPYFMTILSQGGRYISDTSVSFNIQSLWTGIIKLNFTPIWRAFIVQSEPLGIPILILILFFPLLAWKHKLFHNNLLLIYCTILLPSATLLNIFIFQIKTKSPFRPPYAIYLLPLALILAAVAFQDLWNLANRIRASRMIRLILLLLAAFFILRTANATMAFKTMRRKTDWRGVASFLSSSFDSRYLLIFDSLSRYGDWEPSFYGFPRYYRGKSSEATMRQLPFVSSRLFKAALEPVLILFQWRAYYLTPYSQYPLVLSGNPTITPAEYHKIAQDPQLKVTEFTGFSVIQLKNNTNNLEQDIYTIITRLLLHLPPDSSQVELHLAAARLARDLGFPDWQKQLVLAESLTPAKNLATVKKIEGYLRRNVSKGKRISDKKN